MTTHKATLLVDANNASEAFQHLYRAHLQAFPKVSLSSFCQTIGLSSKGNLSSILAGHRRLPQKYFNAVCKAFDIKGLERRLFKSLVDLSHATKPKDQEKLRYAIDEFKATLRSRDHSMTFHLNEPWVFEIFCAFGVASTPVTLAKLAALVGCPQASAAKALQNLIKNDLVKQIDHDQYELISRQIMFSQSDDGRAHIKFIERCISDAERNVKRYFEAHDQALFVSSLISVNKSTFSNLLHELRGDLEIFQNRIESEDADSLVRFNVQIYPMTDQNKSLTPNPASS